MRGVDEMRLFVAINIPPELKDSIAEVQKYLPSEGIKPVRPESIHITLKFLGEVSNMDGVLDALKRVEENAFDVRVHGVGVFPNRSRIQVIWVGCEGEFLPLVESIENVLAEAGFPKEKRDFHPHITIARVKWLNENGKKRILKLLDDMKDKEFGKFRSHSFSLMKSTLTPKGPIYEEVKEFGLR